MDRTQRHAIREIGVAGEHAGPYDITPGPDGALWLTLVQMGAIARLALDGSSSIYPLDSAVCKPGIITAGPDGALWFTRFDDHQIGRITTAGETRSFALADASSPFGIAVGADDAL